MNDSNVGSGMVPCRKNCRCDECTIERLRTENSKMALAFSDTVANHDSEITRLRAERDRWQHTADTQDDLLNQQAQRIADLEGALRDAIVYLKECGKQFASIGDHVMQAGCYNVTERLEDALKEAQ